MLLHFTSINCRQRATDKDLVQPCFQNNFKASLELLLDNGIIAATAEHGRFVKHAIAHLRKKYFPPDHCFKWDPPFRDGIDDQALTQYCYHYITLWFRINAAHYLMNAYTVSSPINPLKSPLRYVYMKLQDFIRFHHPLVIDYIMHGSMDWQYDGDDDEHTTGHRSYYVDDDIHTKAKHTVITSPHTPTAYLKSHHDVVAHLSANQRLLWQRYQATPLTRELFQVVQEWDVNTMTDADFKHWQPFAFEFDTKRHTLLLRLLLCINTLLALRVEAIKKDTEMDFELQRLLASFIECIHHCTRELGIAKAKHWWDCELELGANGEYRPSVLQRHYPGDLCGFWAGDLPNLSHVIPYMDIWRDGRYNEKPPKYDDRFVGELLIKTLTFCSMSRGLVKRVIDFCQINLNSWRFVSHVMWCSLGGLYREHTKRSTDMDELLTIYQLTHDKDRFCDALRKGKSGAVTSVIFIAFRDYLLYLFSFNPQWRDALASQLDMEALAKHTREMGDTVRLSSNLTNAPRDDPLFYARQEAFNFLKNNKLEVVRLRKQSYVDTMLKYLNAARDQRLVVHAFILRHYNQIRPAAKILFKTYPPPDEEDRIEALMTILQAHMAQDFWQDDMISLALARRRDECYALFLERPAQCYEWMQAMLKEYERYLSASGWELPSELALQQINYVMRATHEERMMFDNLQAPQMGMIEPWAVKVLYGTHKTYMEKGKPSGLKNLLHTLNWRDFVVIDHYFRVVALFDDVELVPLHPDIQAQIDHVMRTKRYHWVGEDGDLPEYAYNTFVTLCCHPERRVTCYSEPKTYGNHLISYDSERQNFLCAVKRKRGAISQSQVDLENIKTSSHARTHRRKFNVIPCNNTAVMVDLRGCALLMKNKRYQHCPSCATLHEYDITGWSYDGYKCSHCRRVDRSIYMDPIQRCFYCRSTTAQKYHRMFIYRMEADHQDERWDENELLHNPWRAFQMVDVCHSHYKLIGRAKNNRNKDMLLDTIQKRARKRRRKNLIKYNR